jgi:hypothetical protein
MHAYRIPFSYNYSHHVPLEEDFGIAANIWQPLTAIDELPYTVPNWIEALFQSRAALIDEIEKRVQKTDFIQVDVRAQTLSLYSDRILIERTAVLHMKKQEPLFHAYIKASIDTSDGKLIDISPLFRQPWSRFIRSNQFTMGRTPVKWCRTELPWLSNSLGYDRDSKYWCLYSLLHGLDNECNDRVSGYVIEIFILENFEKLSANCSQ